MMQPFAGQEEARQPGLTMHGPRTGNGEALPKGFPPGVPGDLPSAEDDGAGGDESNGPVPAAAEEPDTRGPTEADTDAT